MLNQPPFIFIESTEPFFTQGNLNIKKEEPINKKIENMPKKEPIMEKKTDPLDEIANKIKKNINGK